MTNAAGMVVALFRQNCGAPRRPGRHFSFMQVGGPLGGDTFYLEKGWGKVVWRRAMIECEEREGMRERRLDEAKRRERERELDGGYFDNSKRERESERSV